MSRTVRPLSVFTVLVTLWLVRTPLPAHGEERQPITVNSVRLSQPLHTTAGGGSPSLAGLLEQDVGQISGHATDALGRPLTAQSVRLTRLAPVDHAQEFLGRQLVATAITGQDGAFSFSGLLAGDSEVGVLSGDEVLSTRPLTLATGTMHADDVFVTTTPDPIAHFTDLQDVLKVGHTVVVTDDSGEKTTGKIEELSALSLVLSGGRRFPKESVTEIRLKDSLWNGTLIGLAIGFVSGAVIGTQQCDAIGCARPDKVLFGYGALFGGLGAAIGAGVDAGINMGGKTVYRSSPSRQSVTVFRSIGTAMDGVRFRVSPIHASVVASLSF